MREKYPFFARPSTRCENVFYLRPPDEGPRMKFALFYEIPSPARGSPESEHLAYKNTLEQAIAGEQAGFHAFWTVEHHFLEEYSHCSNPEVLYGAIAARTHAMRLGYGVRLMPKPYNHPVRTAESVAVLDLLSDGRVDFGTGRSATRIELEGFGVDPHETREMWREAIEHVVDCWTNERTSFQGKHWSLPDRRVQPKPLQQPHPPIWGATTSDDGHQQVGELGLGLCSFAVGVSPEEVKKKIDIYRASVVAVHAADRQVREQPGRDVHDGAVRADRGRSARDRARVVRVVPEGRRPPDRRGRRMDGGAQAGARQLRLRGRHARRLRRRLPRPAQPRVPRRHAARACSARPTSASTRASATKRPASTCCCAS